MRLIYLIALIVSNYTTYHGHHVNPSIMVQTFFSASQHTDSEIGASGGTAHWNIVKYTSKLLS